MKRSMRPSRPWFTIGGVLTAAALATAFIMNPASATPTTAAELDGADFRLERSDTDPALLSALTDTVPGASVGEVVASANRTAEACKADVSHFSASFCWESGDNTVKYWYPQGLTSSADANAEGTIDGKEVLLASWYDKGTNGANRGARLSFVDMSNPDTPKYRHILLVEPTGTTAEPDFKEVVSHAGGLVWHGNNLYVCDTFGGMRVFDMTKLLEVSSGVDSAIGRQSDGTYHARNYAFAAPQVAKYNPSTADNVDRLRFSQVSLDRTSSPNSLVVSEWDDVGDKTRIVRFDVDDNGTVVVDDDGIGYGDYAYHVGFRSMQGATSIDGVYYVHRSNSAANRGDFIKWTPGSTADIRASALPIAPEDVTYWAAKDQLWSHTEVPGKRVVFASKASAW